ncbi:unnamed protein product [Paramecium sonneborni]|uniref:Uncharacterized protein n=1 Tax=Paramecium sonneborni TaxID=65129 RepID=A0A8S1QWX1_9CILI|nr:unnamed protein product [Paramecium sonneborni]
MYKNSNRQFCGLDGYQCIDKSCSKRMLNLLNKVGGQGCIKKQIHCSNFKRSGQCHKTILNQTTKDDCKWIIDKCY